MVKLGITNICQENLSTIQQLCTDLGIPSAQGKLKGPTHCLTFLGIEIDTCLSIARLPKEKLTQIKSELHCWLKKRRAKKWQILSLVGLLQHASKVVVPGRSFTACMYFKAVGVKKLNYFTKLNKTFCTGGTPLSILGMNAASCISLTSQRLLTVVIPQTLFGHGIVAASFMESGSSMHGQLKGQNLGS